MNHLIILPILWPLLVALLTMLPPFDQNLLLRRCLSIGGSAVLVLLSVLLVLQSSDTPAQLYQLGNWPAPFWDQFVIRSGQQFNVVPDLCVSFSRQFICQQW